MSDAVNLAAIFGPFLTIMGLWMLLYIDNLTQVYSSVKNSPGCLYILGLINLLLGLVIINTYNEWQADLTLLVTLLGWVTLFRGLLFFFIPQLIVKTTALKKKTLQYIGTIPLVWGLLLSWFAFYQ